MRNLEYDVENMIHEEVAEQEHLQYEAKKEQYYNDLQDRINQAIDKIKCYELIRGYYDGVEEGYSETYCNDDLQDDLLNILRGNDNG